MGHSTSTQPGGSIPSQPVCGSLGHLAGGQRGFPAHLSLSLSVSCPASRWLVHTWGIISPRVQAQCPVCPHAVTSPLILQVSGSAVAVAQMREGVWA